MNTMTCLLYTSDAADEARSVDLGGRRIINKKNDTTHRQLRYFILRCIYAHTRIIELNK
ncbi:hypothetical protein PVA38_12145 [Streptococcus pneumoniae D39]|nr:hypothetical protein PVA38_12145 [Streptococcus pneumoniae D39]